MKPKKDEAVEKILEAFNDLLLFYDFYDKHKIDYRLKLAKKLKKELGL